MVYLLAQALTERNPASHAIRYVGLFLLALVAVMVAVEIVSWLREKWSNRRAGLEAPELEPGGFKLREPDTELHSRYKREPPLAPTREQRANEPTGHSS